MKIRRHKVKVELHTPKKGGLNISIFIEKSSLLNNINRRKLKTLQSQNDEIIIKILVRFFSFTPNSPNK